MRIRVNQMETLARTTEPVGDEFLALAEIVESEHGATIKLTPLGWLEQKERLSLHEKRNLLATVKEHLVLMGLSPWEEYLPWAYTLTKHGLPLKQSLLQQLVSLSRRYDSATINWILEAMRQGFILSEESADFLRHLTSWIFSSMPDEEFPDTAEKVKKLFSSERNIPLWLIEIFGEAPWVRSLLFCVRWENTLALARHQKEKNTLYFLIEEATLGRWYVLLEWTEQAITVGIRMDPGIWEVYKDDLEKWAQESEKRWNMITPRRVNVKIFPWENPWEFFLSEEEPSMRGINLYV
ncbi:hypothetical protein [Thermospira aquatica]|uniref:Uncharacterized protein n=1 Tax=Thermospira aquatica TaxID=2828656 RepID=A0AAX3BEU7_9SPIR|nr:hypothetical protein [Thermospira aquatica]URA10744.1 hypothetical protein KDW03_02775 [Thermospira aquatica]